MNNRFFLVIIIFLAFFLRIYKVTTIPPSLFLDEVDAGYQANYFLKNQSDYFGNKYPVHFRSFSDYRTSAYIYSISLIQKLTGNSELSVRLPSVIFSTFSIFIFYLITKSIWASFLLAINPWSIHYGRTGFEVSGMLLFFLLGIFFLKRYLLSFQVKHLVLFSFFFCITPYFYSTAKLFLPIVLVVVFIVWFKKIVKLPRIHIILFILLSGILLSPMAFDTIKGVSGYRFSYISIFTKPHREQITDSMRYEDIYSDHIGQVGVKTPSLSFVFHNKLQLVWENFINNYIQSFNTSFLFLVGDSNPRHGFGNFGLLYFLDFLFIPLGIYFSLKKKSKLSIFFLVLLLLSPIPYALTRDSLSPHSTRLILMLPSLIYFSSLTLKRFPYFSIIFLVFLFTFFHYYRFHYPQTSARSWDFGMKEAVIKANLYQKNNLIFSNKTQSFLLFYTFYSNYYPGDSLINHLKNIDNSSFSGQLLDNSIYFGNINFDNLNDLPAESLIVVSKSEFSNIHNDKIIIIDQINKQYLNQEEFILLKINEK